MLTFGGLIPPSSSFEVNLILTSFLPTAFSTLVEPFWVLLNRLLCILQPFQDLWVKPKSADRSMQARYTAVPPPLAIWRAVKSGHYLLVGVCFVALLANVLAVGLGGLFNEAPARITYKVPILAMKNAALTAEGLEDFRRNIVYAIASDYADPFYVAMANLSYGTPFLPWTDAEFFYLPVGISGQNSSKDTYTAKTIGVGVEPLCLAAGPIISVDEPPGIPTESREGGTREGCPPTYYPSSLNMNTSNYAVPDGPAAVELVETVTSSPNITECDMSLVVGWSRANIQNKTGSMNTSLIVCRPQFKTAEFNITFDSQGYIQNTTALSNFSSTLPYPDFALHEKAILNHFNHKLQHRDLQWHNDTVSREWFHYLLMVYTGNRDILDARAPLPDPEIMVPSVTSVYKMLFTVFLALNQYVFEDNDGQGTDTALGYTTEPRIFVSTPALIVSLTILAFNIIMAIVFYGWGIKLFLPRMPTTIGSLLAYIAPSKAVREYSAGKLENSKSFKFGRFVGEDGKAHIGIDYSEKVVPLKLSSLERGDTMPATSKFGRLWHRSRTGRQGETWL